MNSISPGIIITPLANDEQKGLSLYGHVAQSEPAEVKSVVAKWLKQLGHT